MSKYDDIINLPHHVSKTRTPMSMENRAAQFAPFSALNGHEEAINETARLTTEKIELTDVEREIVVRRLISAQDSRCVVVVTYFLHDDRKDGGEYKIAKGVIRRIDEFEGLIVFENKLVVKFEDIYSVDGDIFKGEKTDGYHVL